MRSEIKKLPKYYRKFINEYLESEKAYEALSESIRALCQIDAKARLLIKFEIVTGSGSKESFAHKQERHLKAVYKRKRSNKRIYQQDQ